MGARMRKIGWAMYDWADSSFATTVMAVFFPAFFKDYWAAGLTAEKSTFYLGLANSLAGLAVALIAPILGAFADKGSSKRKFLVFFAFMGAMSVAALFFIGQGHWAAAAVLFGIGILGFSGAHTFYDALLMDVAGEAEVDMVSSLGYSLGYIGGGLLLLVNILMFQMPLKFGIADGPTAIRISFLMVAAWWILFSLPILALVKEKKRSGVVSGHIAKSAFAELVDTLKRVTSFKKAFVFLIAYWFYIDGVDTVIKMAVDYGSAIGFSTGSLITAILMVQFIGFPAALLTGWLSTRIGVRRMLLICLGAYIVITVFAFFMNEIWHFFALAAAVGLFQGGIQALSRSYFSRLIPPERSAEFFGFYNMLGKFATIIGPTLMGVVTLVTKSNRLGILSIIILFVAGGAIFLKITPGKDEGREGRES
jgi:UMF1 family MFS transporter